MAVDIIHGQIDSGVPIDTESAMELVKEVVDECGNERTTSAFEVALSKQSKS